MSTPTDNTQVTVRPTASLIVKFASKYGVDADKLMSTLKATAFKTKKGDPEVSNEQMMALLIVADQYHLNPFTKELFAFPDKKAGIIPVVSVDGWSRIINEHPAFDGLEFVMSTDILNHAEHKDCPAWIETVIYRKDRSHPIRVKEYLDEVYREPYKSADGYVVPGPWQTHTKRFLRHKSLIQCSRIAFGFAGIYDQDEAERILETDTRIVATQPLQGATRGEQAKDALKRTATPTQTAKPATTAVQPEKTAEGQAAKNDSLPETKPEVPRETTVEKGVPETLSAVQLAERCIALLNSAKTMKDLRSKWDKVIDDYVFQDIEIPQEVENRFHMMKEQLS